MAIITNNARASFLADGSREFLRRGSDKSVKLAFIFTLVLVAMPGLAAVKFVAILTVLLIGSLKSDFGGRGITVGYSAILALSLSYIVASLGTVNHDDRDSHLLRIFSFYASFACVTYVRRGLATTQALDKLCLSAASLMALFKVVILISVLAFGFSLVDVLSFFGFESVTATIGESLFRLQFPSDFIILFLLSIYIGGNSRLVDTFFIISAAVVIFLSFSRFIFLCFFVGIFVRFIWLRRADLITWISAIVVVIALISFSDVLIDRFVGEGSDDSDDVRIEQIQKLEAEIVQQPIFGLGVGASAPNFLRSETLPYSYEVQWHATVMQLGFLGTFLLIANVVMIVFWGIKRLRSKICLTLLLAMWVFAGFTNPFITSLGSAVGLSLARRRAQLVEAPGNQRYSRTATSHVRTNE